MVTLLQKRKGLPLKLNFSGGVAYSGRVGGADAVTSSIISHSVWSKYAQKMERLVVLICYLLTVWRDKRFGS